MMRHSSPIVAPVVAAAAISFAALIAACGSPTAACDGSGEPAMIISAYDGGLANPVHNVTIIYDRHGDDSLTVLRNLSTAVNVSVGRGPGIYDFRLLAPGYADYLWTNVQIAGRCSGAASASQVFMQKLP
jgi:hypothetical protein